MNRLKSFISNESAKVMNLLRTETEQKTETLVVAGRSLHFYSIPLAQLFTSSWNSLPYILHLLSSLRTYH